LSTLVLTIKFSEVHSHISLIDQFFKAFDLKNGDVLNLSIDLNTPSNLYSDHLCLIVSFLNYLRSKGITVNGSIKELKKNTAQVKYASRVDFFNLIGASVHEDFERFDASQRFTEILKFENDNALDLHKRIMKILLTNDLNDDMLRVLDYCLWEVIDNTLNHSDESFRYGVGSGHLCCQYFPNKKEIRLLVADNGQGIHQALTTHPKSKHSNLTEEQAISRCIEKGMTNSLGMGFGLWATTTLVKENKGTLLIHSGFHQLQCKESIKIQSAPYWQGTYIYLKLNTDIAVSYDQIFGKNMTQRNNFDDLKDAFYGNLDDLW